MTAPVTAPVTARLLEDLLSAQHVSRTPLDRQSTVLVHAESRTFLADIGIPKSDGALIHIRDDLAEGLTPLLSHGARRRIASLEKSRRNSPGSARFLLHPPGPGPGRA